MFKRLKSCIMKLWNSIVFKMLGLSLLLVAHPCVATEVTDIDTMQVVRAEIRNEPFMKLLDKHVIRRAIKSGKDGADYNIFVRALCDTDLITVSIEPGTSTPVKDVALKADINNYNVYFDNKSGSMFTHPLMETDEIIATSIAPSEGVDNQTDYWAFRVDYVNRDIIGFSLLDKRMDDESHERRLSNIYDGDRFFGDKMDYPSSDCEVQLPLVKIDNPEIRDIVGNNILCYAKEHHMTNDCYDLFIRTSEVMPLDICTDTIRRVEFDLEHTAHMVYGAVYAVAIVDGYHIYFDKASARQHTRPLDESKNVSLRPDRNSPERTSLWVYEFGLPLYYGSEMNVRLIKTEYQRSESKEHYLYTNRHILPLINARTY